MTGGLASRIKARRGPMNLRAAAAEIGISPTTLLRLERGGEPTMPVLAKIDRWTGHRTEVLPRSQKPKLRLPADLPRLILRASEAFRRIDARGH